MLKNIGRKFIQGAKAEIEENPPQILNFDRLLDIAEAGLALVGLGILIFGGGSHARKATTVITNNYYYYK